MVQSLVAHKPHLKFQTGRTPIVKPSRERSSETKVGFLGQLVNATMPDEQASESSQDMKFEPASAADPITEASKNSDGDAVKRPREDDDEEAKKQKKPKVDNEIVEKKEGSDSGGVSVGPKTFGSSEDMFEYFYKILHFWTPNLNINKVNLNSGFS